VASKTKYPGVRIRGKSIQIDFRYKGIRCRETLRIEPTSKNLEKANNRLGKIKDDITFNVFVYANYFPNSNNAKRFGDQPTSNLTISQALDWWWEYSKPGTNSTANDHAYNIKNHIKPGIGSILLRELRPRQVKKWINLIDLSESTKNNIMSPLRKMFSEAYSEELVDDDIMKKVPNFKRQSKEKNPLGIDQVDKLLKNIKIPEVKSFYQFAIWSGLSTGEQIGLQWGDVNFKESTIKIERVLVRKKQTKTKNKFRKRQIELLTPSYQALKALLPKDYVNNPEKYTSDYIFKNPNTSGTWTSESIANHWNNNLKILNIPYRKAYETRHTFASIMITACLPDGWIRQQMGHATMKMLETVYGKWLNESSRIIDWVLKHTSDDNNGSQFKMLFLDQHAKNNE